MVTVVLWASSVRRPHSESFAKQTVPYEVKPVTMTYPEHSAGLWRVLPASERKAADAFTLPTVSSPKTLLTPVYKAGTTSTYDSPSVFGSKTVSLTVTGTSAALSAASYLTRPLIRGLGVTAQKSVPTATLTI